MGDRVILHCDLNCFFASVELLSHPDLRDIPTAVCGDPASRHGIILAKNEPAKRLRRPDGGDHLAGQEEVSRTWCCCRPTTTCTGSTPGRSTPSMSSTPTWWSPSASTRAGWTSPAACTSSAATPRPWPTPCAGRLRQELGLTISVGVSFNKVFAKLGSDYKKPDATTVITRENWQDIVWPLPVGDLLYRGPGRREAAAASTAWRPSASWRPAHRQMLETLLGKLGLQLHEYANGLDGSPGPPAGPAGAGEIRGQRHHLPPKPHHAGRRCSVVIAVLSDSVAMRLRQQGLYCGGVSVCPAERPVPHRVPANAAPRPHPL